MKSSANVEQAEDSVGVSGGWQIVAIGTVNYTLVAKEAQ